MQQCFALKEETFSVLKLNITQKLFIHSLGNINSDNTTRKLKHSHHSKQVI